jgi:hypothetical protein
MQSKGNDKKEKEDKDDDDDEYEEGTYYEFISFLKSK